jgi:methylenetetrahydrofolate dehydrogenase (NADP+)/methenyltetrahydrofolate cyclohydrolase
MKLLNGSELVGFIKERQAKQVRALRQAERIQPRLAIVRCDNANPVIDTYVRLKKRYGEDILIEVDEYKESPETVRGRLTQLAEDEAVHGIIVQLPVEPAEQTDELLELVPAHKDVDGLTAKSMFDAATPMAINWLLVGYGIDPRAHSVAVVGEGRLVGAPLVKMWRASGIEPAVFTKENASRLAQELPRYSLVVTAIGVAHGITSTMLQAKAVVVDAGTSSEDGVIKGDLSEEVRERDDLTLTPQKGGVGPLTVAALFDNVIRSARNDASERKAKQ